MQNRNNERAVVQLFRHLDILPCVHMNYQALGSLLGLYCTYLTRSSLTAMLIISMYILSVVYVYGMFFPGCWGETLVHVLYVANNHSGLV